MRVTSRQELLVILALLLASAVIWYTILSRIP